MAMYNASFGGDLVEIDGVPYDGDLKLESCMEYETYPDLPFEITSSSSIFTHENQIYIASSTELYKLENKEWVFVTTLPYENYRQWSGFFSYHGYIYMIGSYQTADREKFMRYDGSTWTSLTFTLGGNYSTAFGARYARIVIYNDKPYMLGYEDNGSIYNQMFSFDEDTGIWQYIGTIPFFYSYTEGICEVYDNKIFFYQRNYIDNKVNVYNGSTWTQTSIPPIGGRLVSDNNKLYLCCHNDRTLVSSPYDYDYSLSKKIYFYKEDEDVWVEDEEAPYVLYLSMCISNNDKVYIFGGQYCYYQYPTAVSYVAYYPYKYKVSCLKKVKMIKGYI